MYGPLVIEKCKDDKPIAPKIPYSNAHIKNSIDWDVTIIELEFAFGL